MLILMLMLLMVIMKYNLIILSICICCYFFYVIFILVFVFIFIFIFTSIFTSIFIFIFIFMVVFGASRAFVCVSLTLMSLVVISISIFTSICPFRGQLMYWCCLLQSWSLFCFRIYLWYWYSLQSLTYTWNLWYC